jgi:hypothetical protein
MTMEDTTVTPSDSTDDADLWRRGVASLTREFRLLTGEQRNGLRARLTEAGHLKEELCRLSDVAGGPAVCAACGGACCRAGRYHATALDLLAFLATGEKPVTPDFATGACPFRGGAGCRLAPARRPYNCVIFICDQIDERLADGEQTRLYSLERDLRLLLDRMGERFGRRLTESFLCAAARTDRDGTGMFTLEHESGGSPDDYRNS